MIDNRPVFVDHRKEPVHLVWDIFEMRRTVISNINRLFPVAPTKLGDICDGCIIQNPERVLVEGFDSLFQADFDAV